GSGGLCASPGLDGALPVSTLHVEPVGGEVAVVATHPMARRVRTRRGAGERPATPVRTLRCHPRDRAVDRSGPARAVHAARRTRLSASHPGLRGLLACFCAGNRRLEPPCPGRRV